MSPDQSHNRVFHQLIDDLLTHVGVDPPQALGLWRRETETWHFSKFGADTQGGCCTVIVHHPAGT